MNAAIRYGLVNAMTGITCAAVTATTWGSEAKSMMLFLIVAVVSLCSGVAIEISKGERNG